MRTTGPCILAAALLIAPLGAPVDAQDDNAPRAYSLKLQKYAGIPNGTAALVVGKTMAVDHRFIVENLGMTQPVRITIRTNQRDNPIRAAVTKFAWTQPERAGTTGDSGSLQFSFRTQGEFQVTLSSAKPDAPYRMLVWVGDEVAKEMPPVVVPRSKWKEADAGGPSMILWAIVGLLAIIAGLLGALLLKRRRS